MDPAACQGIVRVLPESSRGAAVQVREEGREENREKDGEEVINRPGVAGAVL